MLNCKASLSACFVFLYAALSGCALMLPQSRELVEQPPRDLPRRVELTDVPFFPQEDFQCGPAALAMAFSAANVPVTPEELVDQVYIPLRKGSLQVEMLAATRRRGLVAYELAPSLSDVLHEISAGTPVIVLENYGFSLPPFGDFPQWHYAVAIGYDFMEGRIIRRSGIHARQTLPFSVFEYLWKRDGHWAMVAVSPERVPASATEARYTDAVIALEKSGHVKAAKTAYRSLLIRWPDNLAGLMGLGNTAYALQDLDEAATAFSMATQIHPNAVGAFNNLAIVLADRGKFIDALAAAERAVSLGGPLLETAEITYKEILQKSVGQPQKIDLLTSP